MKKGLSLAALAALLFALPATSQAHSYDPDSSEHPLRYVAYVLHPVGVLVQDVIFRPIHKLVSGPNSSYWFGHEPREADKY